MRRPAGPAADSLLLAAARLAAALAGMLTAKVLAVALSLEQYGAYAQLLTVASLLEAVSGCGLPDCVNYHSNSQNNGAGRRWVESAFLLQLLLGAGALALAVVCRTGIAAAFSNPELAALLWLAGLRALLNNQNRLYQVLLVSAGQARLLAARNLLAAAGRLAGVSAAALLTHSLRPVLMALLGVDLAQLMLFHRSASRRGLPVQALRGTLRLTPQLLAYGVPVGVYAVTGALTRDLDKLVVSCLADPAAAGLYANCSRVLPLDLFVSALATVLLPGVTRALARGDRPAAAALLRCCLRAGCCTVWPLGCALLLTADQAIPLLYSPAYLPGKPVFLLYILDSMVRFAGMHLALTAAGKTRRLMRISLVALLVNAVLDPPLYFLWGLPGPAAATLLSAAVYAGLILRASRQELGVRWAELTGWRETGPLAVCLLWTGGLCLALKRLLLRAGLGGPAVLLGTAGAFLLLNLALGRKRLLKLAEDLAGLKRKTEETPAGTSPKQPR